MTSRHLPEKRCKMCLTKVILDNDWAIGYWDTAKRRVKMKKIFLNFF